MKVTYLILNSFEFDTRARLEVDTIGGMGHNVEIIGTVGGNRDNYNGYPIHRIRQYRWPSRKVRFVQYNLAASLIASKLNSDVIHAVDLDVLSAGYQAARKTGKKLIYEARELYTELEPLRGRKTIRAIWRGLETRLIGKADRIITINESIASELCARYGIEKPLIIRNVARTPEKISPVNLHEKYDIPPDHKILIYQGVLREGQGILYQLEIILNMNKTVLLFMGAGPLEKRIVERSKELGIEGRIVLGGRVTPEELYNYTVSADAGLLLMQDVALNNRLALPQKLFQYLAAGIPQIVSPMPEISGFVEREKTGVIVSFGDAKKAAGDISALLFDEKHYNEMRRNCARSAGENNWEKESEKLIALYRELEEDND